MTRLDALNEIMRRCGRREVPALDTGGASTAGVAERILEQSDLEIQAYGWLYNTRYDVELTPNTTTGIVTVPTGTLKIDSWGVDERRNVTQVGQKLFDLDSNTDVFSGIIRTKYVVRFDFECIPAHVRLYIVADATLRFAQSELNMAEQSRQVPMAMAWLNKAKARAHGIETRVRDTNLLAGSDSRALLGGRIPGESVLRAGGGGYPATTGSWSVGQ